MNPWFVLGAVLLGQVPPTLGYQGRLLKADGTPEAGVQAFTLSLFGGPVGGSPLWTETQQVALADGFFSLFLASQTPFGAGLWDGAEKWLEVSVASNLLAPRQKIASVAYALRAGTAVAVSGGTVDATSIRIGGITVIDSTGQLSGPAAALDWSQLRNVPAGFADGVDNDTTYSAGTGLSLAATTFSVSFAGSGTAATASRSDHTHAFAPQLLCTTALASVSNAGGGYRTATAQLPAGYTRTGGGCDCGSNNPGRLAVIDAPILTNAWRCGCKDHSAGDGNGSTTAYVIGCLIQ